jgi:hypothetical protein
VRVERGASQILFGLLPGQTADLEGRIWRVANWADPVATSLDQDSVRQALITATAPWAQRNNDDGLTNDLRARANVEIVSLNMDRGVVMEPFPQQWRCKTCGRLARSRTDRCPCGGTTRAQMQFVAYHTCGAAREPYLPRGCPAHGDQVAVRLPGTATARELRFFCPVCNNTLSDGFPFQACDCGGGAMSLTVHRAAVVYSPHFAVLVNPPDPAVAARLRAGGGGARALEWVLNGMEPADPAAGRQTVAGLIDQLRLSGISEETARELARQARERGEVDDGGGAIVQLPDTSRERIHDEALSLASAVTGGRIRVADMISGTTPPLRTLYEGAYVDAMRGAHLEGVDLLSNFPVATLAFGYTRGDLDPGAARLVPFRERGHLRAYGSLSRTEALLFRLDPLVVHRYLVDLGHHLPPATDRRSARLAILQNVDLPFPAQEQFQPLGGEVIRLLHSYAHRSIRRLAAFAGIERDGLAEYLLPHHLAFVIYAASRGDFVLGGLQAVFETSLDRFLDDLVTGESRCALDPGCRAGGGACMACIHLGEPSCRWFNRFLDRSCLFGQHGFLRRAD